MLDLDGVLINSWKSIVLQGLDLILHERVRTSNPMQSSYLYCSPLDYHRVLMANKRSGDPRLNIPDMLQMGEGQWVAEEPRLMKLHSKIFEQHKHEATLYEGALDLVAAIARRMPLAALTTRSRDMFTPDLFPQLLPPQQPSKYFSVVVTRSDVAHPKPDPQGLFQISKALGIPTHRMVLVGDMPTDMRLADELSIGITQIPTADANSLWHAGAHYMVESLGEVYELLGPGWHFLAGLRY